MKDRILWIARLGRFLLLVSRAWEVIHLCGLGVLYGLVALSAWVISHLCVCELVGPVGASRSAWVLVFLWIRPHGFQISVQFSFCAPATKPCSELIYVCVDDFSFDSHIRLYNIIICVSKLTCHSNSKPTVTQTITLKILNLSSHRLNIPI